MADLRNEVLQDVPGIGYPFADKSGTIRAGTVGKDGMQQMVVVWVEGPSPTTYYNEIRCSRRPREIIASPELLAETKANLNEVKITNLEEARTSMIVHNTSVK